MVDCQLVASSSTTSEAGDAVNASGRQLFAQFKQLLEAAEAKVTGFDELHALLQNEQRSVGQLERALQLQQRHIDRFTAQDLLLAQLTQQMAIQAHAWEQLQATCRQQQQQLAAAKAEASQLQQEVGHKRKRIEALEWHGACQEQSISKLEHKTCEYKRICSYVARESQVRTFETPYMYQAHILCILLVSTAPDINSLDSCLGQHLCRQASLHHTHAQHMKPCVPCIMCASARPGDPTKIMHPIVCSISSLLYASQSVAVIAWTLLVNVICAWHDF